MNAQMPGVFRPEATSVLLFLSKPTAVRTRSHQKAILRSGLPFLLTKSKLGVVGIMASQATLDLVYNVFFVIIVV